MSKPRQDQCVRVTISMPRWMLKATRKQHRRFRRQGLTTYSDYAQAAFSLTLRSEPPAAPAPLQLDLFTDH